MPRFSGTKIILIATGVAICTVLVVISIIKVEWSRRARNRATKTKGDKTSPTLIPRRINHGGSRGSESEMHSLVGATGLLT